ncbi:Predicted arabinose efflux permease, MFS family [Granulicella pectinivorans]|jgi:predicted MFS family arabinose efflux permease|uniref:Predicted arabinose efflux permease, MFS family n=1 Tax=Granulicella pectinivorans TaxID=474950 RepID=A0A1I6L0G8_9BACT|nr:MFS transporter [Granulicella pectinivorans]SFR96973.1 Predicted arabinose efflux permease, MFS family [Granulicella pectinivorans]
MKPSAKPTNLPFLGLACAVGVSTIYYNQPLLLEMGQSYHAHPGETGFVAVATQIGYAVGLLCFVPLGDVLERRALMVRMYGAVAVALLLVGLAPSLFWLIAFSVIAGALASVTHIVLPIAPDLVEDNQRGRAIGIVMTGLLLGILLARTFAGWVSRIHGWRLVFLIAAAVNLAFVPLLWKVMPKLPPKQPLTYGEAMSSLWTLWRTQPLLRESCVLGALVFASFSCFWTTLAFLLDSHYGLGPGVAGTFGVVGAAGALTASIAGRFADKHGPRWVLTLGGAVLAASYLFLWGEEKANVSLGLHLAALAVGVIVLDVGAQMMQVANQTRIFGLVPSARSRLNTVYMTVYFSGAAAGSALSTVAWVHWKWNGVCGLALTLIALAGLRHATGRRGERAPGAQTETVLHA